MQTVVYSAWSRTLHFKILSPKTYPCKLCAITYDHFGIKKEWGQFIKEMKADIKFLHRDDFLKTYNITYANFSCILTEKDSHIEQLKATGLDDRAILDAALIISYFNFVNRMILSLGVDLEEDGGVGYNYE